MYRRFGLLRMRKALAVIKQHFLAYYIVGYCRAIESTDMGKTLTCCTQFWRLLFVILNIVFVVS